MSPQAASQLSPEAVEQLATEAHKQNPSIVGSISSFYAQHPALVKSLGRYRVDACHGKHVYARSMRIGDD